MSDNSNLIPGIDGDSVPGDSVNETPTVDEPYKPNAPRILRAVIYYVGIVSAFLAIIAMGVSAVFWASHVKDVAALAGVWNSAWLYVSNQFAVSYLPPKVN